MNALGEPRISISAAFQFSFGCVILVVVKAVNGQDNAKVERTPKGLARPFEPKVE
jgi:hypothetical protein